MTQSEESMAPPKEIALLEMLSLVYEEMDIDAIEERFVNLTAEIFGFDRVGLFFVKHRKGMLQGKLCRGFEPGAISSLEIPVTAGNLLTRPLVTGFPVFNKETNTDASTLKLGLTNFALVPIVNKKRLSCWQIKKCYKNDCPAFGKRWLRCWLVPGTKCGDVPMDDCGQKELMCQECEVYAQQDVDAVEGVMVVDNSVSNRPIHPEQVTLLSIVSHAVGGAINNAKVYSRTLRESIHDELTGLYNRRFFNERLLDEVERTRRYGGHFSIVICDIDFFKRINDTFGHPIGDRVLVQVASVLQNNIRSSDMACRYGGEEFAVLLLNADKDLACSLAEQLRKKMAATPMADIGGDCITASFGVATFGKDSISFEGLVSKADQALYQAKTQGRNQVQSL
ncbi:MAG: GGDEF domain-containing protein [Desulfobulbaceae bacterium]|nr:GGDEF domain-containing protein [Desulfobulbaceae bacterium]HIJ90142.1 GGDEF domain-containing protein [Deltaproteobacteria bacterium]